MDVVTWAVVQQVLQTLGNLCLVIILPLTIANFLNIKDIIANIKQYRSEDALLHKRHEERHNALERRVNKHGEQIDELMLAK